MRRIAGRRIVQQHNYPTSRGFEIELEESVPKVVLRTAEKACLDGRFAEQRGACDVDGRVSRFDRQFFLQLMRLNERTLHRLHHRVHPYSFSSGAGSIGWWSKLEKRGGSCGVACRKHINEEADADPLGHHTSELQPRWPLRIAPVRPHTTWRSCG